MDDSKNTALNVYRILRRAGMTHAGSVAMMCNMAAESRLKSTIVEIGKQPLSDAEYTAMADSGGADWLVPVGYGLCQWTLAGRKRRLREFAQSLGVSVGDESMQCRFAVKELQEDFSKLWAYLISDRCEVNEACDWICREFENPAIKNYSARRAFAEEFDYLRDGCDEDINDPVKRLAAHKDQSIMHLQTVLACNGYWDKHIDGARSIELCNKLIEFANDLKNYI